MSTITLTKTSECASGDHINIAVSGDATGNISIYASELADPITEDDKVAFLKVLLRIAKKTRTKAQIKTLLTSGWTLTI